MSVLTAPEPELLEIPDLSEEMTSLLSPAHGSLSSLPASPVLTYSPTELLIMQYQQDILALKKKQIVWAKSNLLYFFHPQDQQVGFFDCQLSIKLAEGTNRSGKTVAGIVDDICHALGFYPWKVPENLRNKAVEYYSRHTHELPKDCLTPRQRSLKIIILEDDWDTADEILISGKEGEPGKLTKYLSADCIADQEKNGQGYIKKITLTNGSSISIDTQKSFVNDPGSFEGKDYDRVHFDEPKRRDLWVSVTRGLVDRKGDQVWTLTPLKEAWIYDQFIVPYQNGDKTLGVFHFDTELNPHVSKEGWEAFKKNLTEDEAEARVHGRWGHLQGLVYKEFIPRMFKDGGNLIEPLTTDYLLDHCSGYGFFDVHQRQKQAWLGIAFDDRGRLIAFDEIFARELIKEICQMVTSKLKFHTRIKEELKFERWFADPICFVDDPVDGHRWADEFVDLGFPIEPASKLREAGIGKTRRAFKDRTTLVCTNCSRLIWELQHYQWGEWRNAADKGEKEKPVDKDDHMVENFYRAHMADLCYVKALPNHGKPIKGYSWISQL